MSENADNFRGRALIEMAYGKWRALALSLQQRENRLAHLADLYSQRRVFAVWKKMLSLKRAKVWKADMKERFRRFRKQQQKRILEETLIVCPYCPILIRFAEYSLSCGGSSTN